MKIDQNTTISLAELNHSENTSQQPEDIQTLAISYMMYKIGKVLH